MVGHEWAREASRIRLEIVERKFGSVWREARVSSEGVKACRCIGASEAAVT